MSDQKSLISKSFQIFLEEAPEHAKAWGGTIQSLSKANALDSKTTALAYLTALSVLAQQTGIPYHVNQALEAGASKQEIISAILLGLPLAGNSVIHSLEPAMSILNEK